MASEECGLSGSLAQEVMWVKSVAISDQHEVLACWLCAPFLLSGWRGVPPAVPTAPRTRSGSLPSHHRPLHTHWESPPPLSAWTPRAPPQPSSQIIPPSIQKTPRGSQSPLLTLCHSFLSVFPVISVPPRCQPQRAHVSLERRLTLRLAQHMLNK